MLFRLRRWLAVMLSLALLPAMAAGAQCASHDAGGLVAAAAGNSSVADGQSPASSAHAHHGAAGEQGRVEHAHHAAPEGNGQDTPHGAQSSANSAPESCCPPTSVPGACSSAMGCGVVSAAQSDTANDATLASVSVSAAPGSVLPPGPSRAPDVPPPRA